jgi:carboxylesterase type B
LSTVPTRLGPVRGEHRADGTLRFLGIPYAQPPVGPLRFTAPVPPRPWTEPLEATAYGPTAQRRPHSANPTIPEPSIPGDAVLNLNVFTPSIHGALPVLVWIHGGGFVAGSAASPWYDGASFNRDGVLLVSIGYRLGDEGFRDNAAVLDWIAALEWVRDNIAAFGGDPNRVTVAGHSAGGTAVLTLLATPAADGLFHAAISASSPGPGLRPVGPDPDVDLITSSRIPLMIGLTTHEFGDVETLFRRPTTVIVEARARAGCLTWQYEFAWSVASFHCADVPFIFDLLHAERVCEVLGEAPPQSLADAVHGAWVRFATDHDPGPTWPRYTPTNHAVQLWTGTS